MILDENFSAICKAIANRGVALNELRTLLEKHEGLFEKIVNIIRKSRDGYQAAHDLCTQLGISEATSTYILTMSLSKISSFNQEYFQKKCDEYKKNLANLNTF